MSEFVLNKMGNVRGHVDLNLAARMTDVVAHAHVSKGAEVAYIHYKVMEGGFMDLDALLTKALLMQGSRATEPRRLRSRRRASSRRRSWGEAAAQPSCRAKGNGAGDAAAQ